MTCLYNIEYSMLNALITYLLMIIIYKYVFNIEISIALLTISLTMIIYMFADTVCCTIILQFTDLDTLRGNEVIQIMSNISTGLIGCLISDVKQVKIFLNGFIIKINKSNYDRLIFFILIILALIILFYNLALKYSSNIEYFVNILVMLFIIVLAAVNMYEHVKTQRTNDKYDNLLEYIQDFEEIVEKIQFDNHEHKNQLATLSYMKIENKEVQEYINNIIGNFNEINNIYMVDLKNIPKGPIKGILYYKIMIAKKNNILISIDTSKSIYKLLSNIRKNDEKLFCNLIGIYLDNAIESSLESKEKVISIEFYVKNDLLNVVICNTFKTTPDLKRIKEKGFSSKGENRGKGLYFVDRMISINDAFTNETTIDNKYFSQRVIYNPKNDN